MVGSLDMTAKERTWRGWRGWRVERVERVENEKTHETKVALLADVTDGRFSTRPEDVE
jgi:hypothetical protein